MSPKQVVIVRRIAALCCAASLGALLFSVRVATTVFAEMPGDRVLAGRIAGRAFTGAYAIAGIAAVIAIFVVWFTRSTGQRLDRWLAGVLLVAAALELFWIAPAITRHGDGWPGSFASLHAVGGGLHLVLAAFALILAWRLLNGTDDRALTLRQLF
ncbi:MAG: DUF4149 domain-containing protein [Burkholderiaceae bacterium]